jgi:PAS domain S-box-containing protein
MTTPYGLTFQRHHPPITGRTPVRLVAIEDDPDLLELTRVVLERAGHEVRCATDGESALPLIREAAPDLVLLDLMLPGLDGFGVLDFMREAGLTDRVPVLLITALTGLDDRRRGLEAGATDIISKPYSPRELTRLVDSLDGLTPAGIEERRTAALAALEAEAEGRRPDRRNGSIRASRPQGEEPLAGVLDLSIDAIVSVDVAQRIIGFNRGAERMFGYRADELLGEPLDSILPPRLAEAHREHIREFSRGPEASRHMGQRREIHGRRRDGSLFPAEASILKNVVDGRLTFTAVLRDVSERKQLIDELRSRARQQAAIATLGQQALADPDLDGFLREAAETITDTLEVDFVEIARVGRSGRELTLAVGIGWDEDPRGTTLPLGRGSHAGYVLEAGQAVATADLANETRFSASPLLASVGVTSGLGVTIPGQPRPFGALGAYTKTARTFTEDDTYFLQAVANVIAALIDRSRVEERLRRFLAAAPDATLVVDAGGRIVSANPRSSEMLGFDVDALVGMEVEELVPARFREVHSAHREEYRNNPALRPMGAGRELSVLRADGTEVGVEIMLNPLETDEGLLVVAALRDVTERRRVEATREAFLRAVSHDLRTPLAALVGFASILGDDETLNEQSSRFVDRILFNAMRIERLLGDLLDLDRLSRGVLRPSRKPTELAALAQSVVETVTLSDGRTVKLEVADDATSASIDPAQVERILENLLVNVDRHTPPGTTCVVSIDRGSEGILMTVEDDGPGVPDRLKQSIFDPFKRGGGDDHSPGTGIGLSLVRRFAELHDGRAWVEDSPRGGARFRVLLPDG